MSSQDAKVSYEPYTARNYRVPELHFMTSAPVAQPEFGGRAWELRSSAEYKAPIVAKPSQITAAAGKKICMKFFPEFHMILARTIIKIPEFL